MKMTIPEDDVMPATLKDTLLSVWRQVMTEDSPTVTLEDKKFRVRKTSRSRFA